jgi:hypothetical protein
MPTTSYPAVGVGGLSEAQWAQMYDCPDGIVNDYTGTSLELTIVSASNVARISPGIVCVNGFYLEVTAAEDLAVPTTAGTYNIAAMYDPALNVADGAGNAATLGPCRLVISTSLDTTGNKRYVLLYQITRTTGQALSAATITALRPFVGATLSMERLPTQARSFPEAPLVGFTHPLGTTIYESSTGDLWRKLRNTNGVIYWDATSIDLLTAFPAGAGLVAAAADEPARYYTTNSRSIIRFEGTLRRNTGTLTTGGDVPLGTMPVGFRPITQQRWPCTVKPTAGGWGIANVTVQASNGAVTMYNPGVSLDWIDLSGVSYRVR